MKKTNTKTTKGKDHLKQGGTSLSKPKQYNLKLNAFELGLLIGSIPKSEAGKLPRSLIKKFSKIADTLQKEGYLKKTKLNEL